MGPAEIRSYLSHLAVEGNAAASTQKVARTALFFLSQEVLKLNLPALGEIEIAKRPARLPEVFIRDEVRATLNGLDPQPASWVLYGSGPRLMERLRLRVKGVGAVTERTPSSGEGVREVGLGCRRSGRPPAGRESGR